MEYALGITTANKKLQHMHTESLDFSLRPYRRRDFSGTISRIRPLIAPDTRAQKIDKKIQVQVATGSDVDSIFDSRWDELLHKQRIPNPVCCAAWLLASTRLQQGEPLVIVAKIGDELIAGGAFSVSTLAGIRTARWLGGSGRPSITPDILVHPDYAEAGDMIISRLRLESHVITLGPSQSEGIAGQVLKSQLPKVFEAPAAEGWMVELPAPKLQKLKKKNLTRLKRAIKDGVSIDVAVHADEHGIQLALERLFILHRSRWEGRSDISRFSANEFYKDWHREVLANMARRGEVRIVEVTENGKLIASVLGMIAGRGALFHTPAVYPGSVLRGAGHIAMEAWVDAAIEAGAEVMNLGRGSGEPQGPKGALGATRYKSVFLKAGRTSLGHELYVGLIKGKHLVSYVRNSLKR
ncbi:MAG: hypothetical protein ACJAWK_000802 [Candidatus Azotimanducaceae bacterium]|jgi:hypothetical protein